MELHGEDVFVQIFQPLICLIVDIDIGRNRHLRVYRVRVHHIAVVLAGNVHPPGGKIPDRMVASPVPVFHLFGIGACRQRHQLMSQADRKNRRIGFIELADLPDFVRAVLRISRPVCQHNAVRMRSQYLLRGSPGRIDRHIAASLLKGADDILLYSEIQKDNTQVFPCTPLSVSFPVGRHSFNRHGMSVRNGVFLHARRIKFRLGARHKLHLISGPVAFNPRKNLLQPEIFIRGDHTVHGSALPELAGQRSCINTGYSRNIISFQKSLNGVLAAEIAGHPGEFPHNVTVQPRAERFLVVPADSVVSDQRIGHADRLPRIGRIGENLQISGHGCVKYYLADYLSAGADACSGKNRTVLQDQKSLHIFILSSKLQCMSSHSRAAACRR